MGVQAIDQTIFPSVLGKTKVFNYHRHRGEIVLTFLTGTTAGGIVM
jgi:hypothetical protein